MDVVKNYKVPVLTVLEVLLILGVADSLSRPGACWFKSNTGTNKIYAQCCIFAIRSGLEWENLRT